MENRLYLLVMRYFFVLLLMLLLSGFWMFVEHTQLTIDGVMTYYSPKTVFGLLETVTPHLFGMGVVVFILTHFYTVVQGVYSQWRYLLALMLFALILLSNVSPFLIGENTFIIAILKFVSVITFIVLNVILMLDLALRLKD